jgi:hypothetical protein
VASDTEVLTSSSIYDWAHVRRRWGRRKSMPFGVYSRTLRTLRAMCEPVERVPPHGAWLWLLRKCRLRMCGRFWRGNHGDLRIRAGEHSRPGLGLSGGRAKAAGCAKVYREKVSGAKTDRAELAKVTGRLEPGDVLV